MFRHYKDLGQISTLVDVKKDYKKPEFDYGQSTTDPSFFEPMQSLITNMRNTATPSEGIFDFNSDDKIPDDVNAPLGRKPGMTHEEISSLRNKVEQSIKSQSETAKIKDEVSKKDLNNLVENTKVIKQVLSSDEPVSNSKDS